MKCPKCNYENEEKALFCSQCGKELKISSREEEKRIATVLFADLKGFTPLSEKLSAEDIRNIIENVFSNMTEIIERNGGYVDKYIGDCIMALFGAPKSFGDDAERAIRAGLEMQKKLAEISMEIDDIKEVNLSMRIGINTGEVITGFIGKKREGDYTALGDTVNTAQRIESVCKPGKVFVSESTFARTKRTFDFKNVPAMLLKGKEKPISIFEVLGYKKEKKGKDEIIQELKFIGRKKELSFLMEKYESAKKKSIFLFLTGEIGAGKTRLLFEFENKIGKQSDFYWIYPDPLSPSLFKGFSEFLMKFYPITEFIKKTESFEEGEEIGEYLDFSLFPEKFSFQFGSEKERRDILFYSFAGFLELLCKRKFSVFFLENAHLLDKISIELIRYLSETFKETPLLFIVSVRKDFFQEEQSFTTLKNFDIIEILPFTLDETKEFLKFSLNIKNLPEEIIEKLYNNTLGNPLYIKNIVQFLERENLLQKKGKEILPATSLTPLKIPGTFIDFAHVVIDKLEKDDKELLTLLSFLGEKFDIEIILALKNTKKIFLKQRLEKLILLGIIETERGKTIETYRFKSPVYREAIMQSLLLKTKSKLHNFIAKKLEQISQSREDIFPVIAMNYENAGNIDKSLFYYKKSLEKAMKNLLYTDGIIYSEKITKIAKDEEDINNAKFTLGQCLKGEGFIDKSEEIFKELWEKGNVHALFEILEILINIKGEFKKAKKIIEENFNNIPKDNLPYLYYYLGMAYHYEDNLDKSEEYYLKAIDLLEENNPYRANILNSLGGIYIYRNELNKALEHYEKLLEYQKKSMLKLEIASTLTNIGSIYYRLGKLEQGLKYNKEALSIRQSVKYKPGIAISYDNIGYYYLSTGDYSNAMEYFKKALEICRIFNMKKNMALILNNMAVIYTKECLYEKALLTLENYIKIAREMEIIPKILYGLYNRSRIHITLGNIEKAKEENNNVLFLSRENNLREIQGLSLANKGDILLIEGDYNGALNCYEESTEIFESLNSLIFQLRNLVRLSRLHFFTGSKEKSREYLERAKEMIKEIKDKEIESEIFILESHLSEEKNIKKEILIKVIQIAHETKNYRLLLKALYFLSKIDASFQQKFDVLLSQFIREKEKIERDKFVNILKFV